MFFRKKEKKRRGFLSRKEPEKKKPGRIKKFFRLLKILLVLMVIGIIALAYHLKGVDRIIEDKFDKPRKWDLPSRVYSDAEYIYPGLDIKTRGIVAKLDRLAYRNTGDIVTGPGDYAVSDTKIDVYLHDFSYPDEAFKGFPVRIFLENSVVTKITKLGDDDELEIIRLEPEDVASIFTAAMEDRTLVKLSDVPKALVDAIIAIEDERFYEHKGVDPVGIMRAMLVNITHLRVVQGGSTLTQQLVKNYFLYPKRSFTRKINEMLIAYRIEKTHTKEQILEAYLNEIYLGQRGSSSVSGVGEAAKLYFAKDVGQLTVAECAQLAGMIRSPSEYNPTKKPEKAKTRRDVVLKKMLDDEKITKDQYTAAIAEKIVTPKAKIKIQTAPYFIDFLKRQIVDLYPQEVLESEGLRIFTTLDMNAQLAAERAVVEGMMEVEKGAANLLPKDHAEPLQTCLISIQPSTGYVRALVGGRDYGSSQFDRCTQALRQPGSTFKPFVYLTAMDMRRSNQPFTPSSIIEDRSFEIEAGGKMWSPQNYDKKEHGPVSIAHALEQSLNIVTSKVALGAGLENVVQTARDAGIKSPVEPVPSIALGAFEVSPLEMASAYTIFPNGGIRAEPISIINIVTKDGEVLEKKALKMKRAFDAAPVYITTQMLKGVMDRGTGASARSQGFTAVAAGKTGTTSNYRDAWFVGFTPSIVSLVWVGFDDNVEIKMSGARAALPIWVRYMKSVVPAAGDGDFAGPSGVVLVKIDPRTGGLTSGSCPYGISEAFIEGTEPQRSCEEIDISTSQTTIPISSIKLEKKDPQPVTEKKREKERPKPEDMEF